MANLYVEPAQIGQITPSARCMPLLRNVLLNAYAREEVRKNSVKNLRKAVRLMNSASFATSVAKQDVLEIIVEGAKAAFSPDIHEALIKIGTRNSTWARALEASVATATDCS